jgi:uroporphyrinogen decarboxylase
MNKKERFLAALSGGPVDRPPVVAWCNFATDAVDGPLNAQRQLAWHRACDWDICKAMNDYRLAPPAGLETIDGPADMLRFARRALDEPPFARQLECLRSLRAAIGPEVPLVETLLEPFFSILFAVGFSRAALIREHPREAGVMLDALTDTLADYVAELRKVPVDGVFYATNGCILPPAARGIDDEANGRFHRPYDLRLLEAMAGLARIVHAHGNPLDIGRVLDYPCEAISWSDRLPGNPSIAEVRRRTPKCLWGGVDETKLHERSLPELRAEVADALAQAGGPGNFILSPGCNVNSGTSLRTLAALRDAARQPLR